MHKLDKVIAAFENTLSIWDGVRDDPEGSVALNFSLTLVREIHEDLIDFRKSHLIIEDVKDS